MTHTLKVRWVKIRDFPKYEVNQLGEIRNIKSKKVLKTSLNLNGYSKVYIYKGNSKVSKTVHRIVAEHFCKRVEGKDFVNHIDGDKTNSNLSNLEWCTRTENARHSFTTVGKPIIRKVVAQIYPDSSEVLWNSIKEASLATGISRYGISTCLRGTVKTLDRKSGRKNRITAGGYRWRLVSVIKDKFFTAMKVLSDNGYEITKKKTMNEYEI